jgi:2',3'-cyclic-nucleotide 2'-phosphodiesterase (5'-nucleotidase family)
MTGPRGVGLGRIAAVAALLVAVSAWATRAQPAPVTLSIIGTTDLHGQVFAEGGRGGLALLGGYLRALRAARAADGGDVLLLDAGDTFQGGVWSNLSEGVLVVEAYNALGYDALAIGNHDFEFGARDDGGDPADLRGALKAAAARATFPFLAANIVDTTTGNPVAWPNVAPVALIEKAGVRVGVVGVMTPYGLRQTLAANVGGLATTALVPTVTREAGALRAAGADVVVVLAHAGGRCERFDQPADLEACDADSEIFQLVRALPAGMVDVVVAGHSHGAVAHDVAGVPVVQAWAQGRGFARVDLTIAEGRVTTRVFAPEEVRAGARYEGATIVPDTAVEAAMQPVVDAVASWRARPVGGALDVALAREAGEESPLGHAVADALRAVVPDADAAIGLWARRGGPRTGVPAGPVLQGTLYDAFPFDNRVARVEVTGEALRQWLEASVRGGRGVPGLSGLVARVGCAGGVVSVDLARPSGAPVAADEVLVVAAMDSFAARAGFAVDVAGALAHAPLVRDALASWFARSRPAVAPGARWRGSAECPAAGA